MIDTTPDYAGLIERLRKPGTWAWHRDDIIASDAKEELVRDDAPFEAATALRTLLESNKELKAERDQLLDKLHCMCGSPIDHSAWEGHTPVSVYDYSLDQERSRAEAAEARLAEALKALDEVRRRARNIWGACSSDQIIDKDVERHAKLMLEYIDAARACLDKKEKSHD